MVRRSFAEVLTGAVVLLVAVGFLGYAIAHSGQTGISGNGYPLYARFSSIAGLNIGSDVRMAGVKIGVVDSASIDPKTYLADVKMTISNGIELPTDSSITVASESLLGGEYLSVQPGANEAVLKPGQAIQYTQGAVSLQDLLGKFIFSATNMVNAMTGSGSAGSGSGAGKQTGNGGGGGQGLAPLKP
ncbi:MAG: outer membrane lipid asymmetry maintenance protein MlaD [Acetobacteraceae bacterium]|nr:outer membrane lipid asymmetry maintenance protein MlaD [Acetobacteraceae bacterium]